MDGICYDTQTLAEPDFSFCGLPSPCADVEFVSDPNTCNFDPGPSYDPAAAACMIESLLAGEAGVHLGGDCPGGQYSSRYLLVAYGDGTLMWFEAHIQDETTDGRATWRAVPDQAYFDACELGTAAGFVACFQGIAESECQLGQPLCPG